MSPRQANAYGFLHPADIVNRITLINHASLLLELDGASVLTDPIYSWTIGFIIPRLRSPGIRFDKLPTIDAILISHNHHDHLNLRTLRRLRRRHQSNVVVPSGLGKYATRTGFQHFVEMNLWDRTEVSGLSVTCVPARHSGTRTLVDWKKTLHCGYLIEAPGAVVYFAGDTAYFDGFRDLANRYSVDVAILPIGAYTPHEWFKHIHLNPETAIKAFLDLGAKILIPMHWGTFKISDEPLDEPPKRLIAEAERHGIFDRVRILRNGESFHWDALQQ